MAISTYSELRGAIADWLERSDLLERTADFIRLAESRLDRVLRLRHMEADHALAVPGGARTLALPEGFREPVALWIDRPGGREPMRFVDAAVLAVTHASGEPRAWTIDGDHLAFDRPWAQACDLTLRMLGRLALSETTPTNAVLRDYPDLYLFGSLMEAAPYLRDAELLSLFAARFEAALVEVRAKESRHRSLARLSVEPALAAIGA
ncbi:hypothetical protein [Phenylobacterium sp.]|uniref:phage adaptor protein n=1 Tax=Phenylobacterium sp. TaxID=1871053 RepID=UPI0027363342|nr:hypothetical protein [Phenylobacterium sp.]MDP3854388.1 hypothetical protein [Phenylobacterium sp.]